MWAYLRRKTLESLQTYWMLFRLIVPITIAVEILSRLGVIAWMAPVLSPVMGVFGLPAELALPVITGLLVGLWAGMATLLLLVPLDSLTVAQMTVLSSFLLIAHALPIEQAIIRRAGPGFWLTTGLRVLGGAVYAFLLYRLSLATGWLDTPLAPAFAPLAAERTWLDFARGLAWSMGFMLVMLLVLAFGMDALKRLGVMDALMKALMPVLRLAGLRQEAAQLTAIGLFLGISFGAGLLIREANSGAVPQRQVLLACIFMGFAHGVIEDTALVIAFGADMLAVLPGRIAFALIATGLIALLLRRIDARGPLRPAG